MEKTSGLILFVSICGLCSATLDILTTTVAVPWTEARQGCDVEGYELYSSNMTSASMQFAGLKDGEYYWTSYYKMNTPFYWKFGCWEISDPTSVRKTDFGQDNSLYKCSRECEDSEFIGLLETYCYCFSASTNLYEQANTPCTIPCPGNGMDMCGQDTDHLSVYKKLNNTDDQILTLGTATDNCVVLNKEDTEAAFDANNNDNNYDDYYGSSLPQFTDEICSEKKMVFCKNYKYDMYDDSSTIYHHVPTPMTWQEAQDRCFADGNDLAFIDGTNSQGVLIRPEVPDGSSSWIGLYRQITVLSINEEIPNHEPLACKAVRADSNGTVQEVYQTCSNKLKSLCVRDSVTTSESVPTTAPTSTAETTVSPTATTETTVSTTATTETTVSPTATTETTVSPTQKAVLAVTGVSSAEPVVIADQKTTTTLEATTSTTTMDATTPSSTLTTAVLTNLASVVEKNRGKDDEDRKKYEPSGLVMVLIALAVIFLIALIIIAFAYKKYRRNRSYQNVNLTIVNKTLHSENGAVLIVTPTPTPSSKPPSPKKPVRTTSMKQDQPKLAYDNVLLDVSKGNFVSQSDQFVPGSRDNVSWNLPFIDASRETLDNLDETQPVRVRKSVILENTKEDNSNEDDPEKASADHADNVSDSLSEQEATEKEPMLNKEDDMVINEEDDIFDDNVTSRLPRSPSEHIDLLFRMSLSGENDS